MMESPEEHEDTMLPQAPPPSGHPDADMDEPRKTADGVEVPATMPTSDDGTLDPPASS